MPSEPADRWASALAGRKATNARWQDPCHLSASRKQHETPEQVGVKHTYSETEGAQNYALRQQHMAQLTPLLFR